MRKRALSLFGLLTSLIIYINIVQPAIDQPITIVGFFIISGLSIFSFFSVLLSRLKRKGFIYSSALAVYATYLMGLMTINGLSMAQVAISTAVLIVMIVFVSKVDI